MTAVAPGGGYQLVILSGETVRAFGLPATGDVTIGRDPASDVLIEDPGVSRQHAVLRVGDTMELEDLGGANGTFVRQTAPAGPGNDTVNVKLLRLVRKKARLAVGDCLLFGTACVVLRRVPRILIPDLAPGIVVRDSTMQALYTDAARVARANINVLLLGETGVGKEVLARAIHDQSQRAKGPFLAVNCAALAESLLESELFGSERGAFTGAVARPGLFEAAEGGTVFLDEVGELPLATQAKLLRVLEARAITRLGATKPRPVDVRILSATHRDLAADSRQGRMRPDLYFRLNGVELLIPPLRSRPHELDVLADSFLSAACRDLERVPPLTLSAATLQVLAAHDWPGNVRELRNAIERAAVMCTESTVQPEHLPPALVAAVRSVQPGIRPGAPSVPARQEAERRPSQRWVAREIGLRREGDAWVLDGIAGAPVRLKHSKGLAYLHQLVLHPGQELHVLGLVGLDQGAGDAGPVLERARINVQRRLKDAIASIGEGDAELGRYLAATVRTGTFCSFTPL